MAPSGEPAGAVIHSRPWVVVGSPLVSAAAQCGWRRRWSGVRLVADMGLAHIVEALQLAGEGSATGYSVLAQFPPVCKHCGALIIQVRTRVVACLRHRPPELMVGTREVNGRGVIAVSVLVYPAVHICVLGLTAVHVAVLSARGSAV
jgi:hypothetical protein